MLILCFAATATAQDLPADCPEVPTDDDSAFALAGVWFTKGENYVKEKRYKEASDAFRCSLGIREHPATVYNAALSAQHAGEFSMALNLARRCLELGDRSEKEIKKLIARLQQKLKEAEETIESDEQKDTGDESPEVEVPTPAQKPPPQEPAPPAEKDEPRWLIPGGYITLGLGAAVLISGSVTGGTALSINSDLKKECENELCPADQGSDLKKMNAMATATNVLIGVGSIATATGVVMLVIGYHRQKGSADNIVLTPIVGPNLAGVAVSGRLW